MALTVQQIDEAVALGKMTPQSAAVMKLKLIGPQSLSPAEHSLMSVSGATNAGGPMAQAASAAGDGAAAMAGMGGGTIAGAANSGSGAGQMKTPPTNQVDPIVMQATPKSTDMGPEQKAQAQALTKQSLAQQVSAFISKLHDLDASYQAQRMPLVAQVTDLQSQLKSMGGK